MPRELQEKYTRPPWNSQLGKMCPSVQGREADLPSIPDTRAAQDWGGLGVLWWRHLLISWCDGQQPAVPAAVSQIVGLERPVDGQAQGTQGGDSKRTRAGGTTKQCQRTAFWDVLALPSCFESHIFTNCQICTELVSILQCWEVFRGCIVCAT